MSPIHLHWFLPTQGDSAEITSTGEDTGLPATLRPPLRAPTLNYLSLVAKAAEQAGFESLLTPTGSWCDDSWIVSSLLAEQTNRIKFLVAFRPGTVSPTTAAAQAATFARHTGDRALINIVTGGDPADLARTGDWLSKEQRYHRTAEFLETFRGVYATTGTQTTFTYSGEHYRIADARLPAGSGTRPPIFLGGASDAAKSVAARFADIYLTWGETPAQVSGHVHALRAHTAESGRHVSVGVRLHVIARSTDEEAWAHADSLVRDLPPERIKHAQTQLATHESEGQRRMLALHGGRTDRLEVSPNLWAGFGLVRGGVGTALVGSYSTVAERLREYHALGVTHFILSGQPHVEEALRFGEYVTPLLADDQPPSNPNHNKEGEPHAG